MKCEICNEGPATDGRAIFRLNKPGEMPARWACRKHLTESQSKAIPSDVDEIVRIIEEDAK